MCKGRILEPLRMSPRFVNFGVVRGNSSSPQRKVSITRGDGGPLHLKLHPVAARGVQATLSEIEPGERYELGVTLVPPFGPRLIRTNLQIDTGVPRAPTVTIPIYATIAPSS